MEIVRNLPYGTPLALEAIADAFLEAEARGVGWDIDEYETKRVKRIAELRAQKTPEVL
jgi:hypothetical protein